MSAPIVYSVSGSRFSWEVYKPETGVKYYVRKRTLTGGKVVGKDKSFNGEITARDYANRSARHDTPGYRELV